MNDWTPLCGVASVTIDELEVANVASLLADAPDVIIIANANDAYLKPWLEVADVICCGSEQLPCPARQWISRVMTRFPGAAMAVVERGVGGSLFGMRDGRLVTADICGPAGVFAALLYSTWLSNECRIDPPAGTVILPSQHLALGTPSRVTVGRWDRVD